jgi:hypothetical protein
VLIILKTELGGGNTNSCLTYMCSAVAYLNANSDGMDNLLVREVRIADHYSSLSRIYWLGSWNL